jgi:hypothetical protein
MSFGMNFTRISLGTKDDNGGEVLFVEGASEEPDQVKAIYVALAHGNDLENLAGASGVGAVPHELPSVAVAGADGAAKWTTTFPQGPSPFKVDDTVLAVGAGVPLTDDAPFFWHQTLTIVSEEAISERIVGAAPE